MEDAELTFLDIKLPANRFLSCRHCGITFVWTGWEQKMDELEPARCPGCRHLLQLTSRWGVVKWYYPRKGFGFITMNGGNDVYVRQRNLRGARRLRRGQVVSFRLSEGKSGLRAVKVKTHQVT